MGCWSTKKSSASSPTKIKSNPRSDVYLPNDAHNEEFNPEFAQPVEESEIINFEYIENVITFSKLN